MEEKLDKPLYIHDCKKCKFLGSYEDKDLYIHIFPQEHKDNYGRIVTLSRSSDEPEDYTSGIIFSLNYWNYDKHNPMCEALVMALMVSKFRLEIVSYCKKYESEFKIELKEMINEADKRKAGKQCLK